MVVKVTHRSGYPRDLRTDGPSGEVEVYWQPEAFTWYGMEARMKGSIHDAFIYIGKSYFRISKAAVKEAGIEIGDRVEIGINKQFLAIKKSEKGIPVRSDRGNSPSRGLLIGARKLTQRLMDDGWPVPCRVACVYDKRSDMLVARKPQETTNAKA